MRMFCWHQPVCQSSRIEASILRKIGTQQAKTGSQAHLLYLQWLCLASTRAVELHLRGSTPIYKILQVGWGHDEAP